MTNSLLFGGKAGYFLPSSLALDWLGVEADLYYSTPHLKHQNYTVDGTGIGQGVLLRMTTLATRVVIRSPTPKPEDLRKPNVGLWERSQPYIGLGPAIFFTSASTGSGSANDTSVGVSLQLGWRLFLTGQTALFAEYKLDNGSLAFTNVFGANTKLQGDYTANNLVLGVSYHFNQ